VSSINNRSHRIFFLSLGPLVVTFALGILDRLYWFRLSVAAVPALMNGRKVSRSLLKKALERENDNYILINNLITRTTTFLKWRGYIRIAFNCVTNFDSKQR
jgi:hypothetical protein